MKLETKRKINKLLKKVKVRRKYKDQLFQKVFADKKDLLDLYNAVNHTTYTNVDDLEITTLEDVIYLSMKNDMSFMISSTLNLYEHQSTYNPNMPIRGLMYFARLYEAYITKNDANIYGSKLIKLPTPRYVIFYNGREDMPDEMEFKLSESFEFKKYSLKTVIDNAIDTCITKGILTDILVKCRNEVRSMLLTEYDEKKHSKQLKEEGRQEGFLAGRQEGENRLNELYVYLINANRMDDMQRALVDKEYRLQLFEEYDASK